MPLISGNYVAAVKDITFVTNRYILNLHIYLEKCVKDTKIIVAMHITHTITIRVILTFKHQNLTQHRQ